MWDLFSFHLNKVDDPAELITYIYILWVFSIIFPLEIDIVLSESINAWELVRSGFPANKPNLLCVRIHVYLYYELLHYREEILYSLKNPHQKLSIKHSFLIYFVLNCQACNNLALNSTRKYAISSREAVNDLPLSYAITIGACKY